MATWNSLFRSACLARASRISGLSPATAIEACARPLGAGSCLAQAGTAASRIPKKTHHICRKLDTSSGFRGLEREPGLGPGATPHGYDSGLGAVTWRVHGQGDALAAIHRFVRDGDVDRLSDGHGVLAERSVLLGDADAFDFGIHQDGQHR